MPLALTVDVREALVREARAALPRECVGLVVGPRPGLGDAIVPLSNVAASDDAFAVDPLVHATTRRAIRAAGRVVVGLYHSHAHASAALSRRDRAALVVDGAPLFPDECALVLGPVADESALHVRAAEWSREGFVDCPITWISGGATIGSLRSA